MTQQLTNEHVWKNGYQYYYWPSDINENKEMESNGSVENIVEYEGKQYSIITDWNGNVRWGNEIANEVVMDEDEEDYRAAMWQDEQRYEDGKRN